jgi:hypothetical protein
MAAVAVAVLSQTAAVEVGISLIIDSTMAMAMRVGTIGLIIYPAAAVVAEVGINIIIMEMVTVALLSYTATAGDLLVVVIAVQEVDGVVEAGVGV